MTPCHHGMARTLVADGRTAYKIEGLAANIWNKQSQTADNGWSSSLGVGQDETTTNRKNI